MPNPAPPPLRPEALRARGYTRPDVLLVSGDAYVDHPSFGTAVVARWLESMGLVVAVAAQPPWEEPEALRDFGEPRLFVGVTAGNMDSMVNHLTAHRKKRHDDAYSPGGEAGRRPNRAAVVYAQLARRAFPDRLVLMGGIEASLRRFVHYDYWADALRRSALVDARADLLVFGMAELALAEIVRALRPLGEARRLDAPLLYGIPGTACVLGKREVASRALDLTDGASLALGAWRWTVRRLPSHERLLAARALLAEATRVVERGANHHRGEAMVQRHGEAFLIAAPPARPLTTPELDAVHELPFTGGAHPDYEAPIPAAEMIQCSVQTNRGCFGGCSFCAIALHEGRSVQSRSEASILREIARLARRPWFRGTVSDLGGPTANTWQMSGRQPEVCAVCQRPSCLHPEICPRLETDHGPLRRLLAQARQVPGVRHVFLASGLRHDLALRDPGFLDDLLRHHVGGHLHVAPEHVDAEVLRLARKPDYESFERFRERFERARRKAGLERYLNPYFISGLPGSTDARMRRLVETLRREGWRPRQVQSFLPTPGSVATAMFHAGVEPEHPERPVAMPRSLADKIRQHRMLTEGLPAGGPRRRGGS